MIHNFLDMPKCFYNQLIKMHNQQLIGVRIKQLPLRFQYFPLLVRRHVIWLILSRQCNCPTTIAKLTIQYGHDVPIITLCSSEASHNFQIHQPIPCDPSLSILPFLLYLWFSYDFRECRISGEKSILLIIQKSVS